MISRKEGKLKRTIKRGSVRTVNEKKKTSTFSKVTKVVIWLMLIAILGSSLITVIVNFL